MKHSFWWAVVVVVASSCVVDVQGAPCVVHTDCPSDQACVAEGAEARCRLGARVGDGPFVDAGVGGGGGTTGGGGGTTGGGGGTTGGGGGMTGGGGGMTGGGGGGNDAGEDAGTDAGFDAGVDAGADGGNTNNRDAGPPDRCDGGCFGTGDCACGIYDVHPTTMRANEAFWIEGRFDQHAGAQVLFPGPDGGILRPATFDGPTRLRAVPPSNGTAGPLSVVTNNTSLPGPTMRVTTFSLGVGRFDAEFDQAAYAIPMPKLTQGGRQRVVARLGDRLLEFADRVAVARLNADGTVGPFSTTGVTLPSERHHPSVTAVGQRLYVIGGYPTGASIDMVSNAVDFCEVGPGNVFGCQGSGQILNTARAGHTAAVVGEWLYVFGGIDPNGMPLASVERARIRGDGSLGPFSVAPVSLQTARADHVTVTVGSLVYMIGGRTGGISPLPMSSIESAIIVNGELTSFSGSIRSLNTARAEATAIVLNRELWVIGGTDDVQFKPETEVAPLDEDGLLAGPFSVSAQGAPVQPRAGASLFVHGNFLFLAGGNGNKGELTSLERASLNRSGDIDSTAPRQQQSGGWNFANARVVVMGDRLFVLRGGTQLAERFAIRPDGSLVPDGTDVNVSVIPERGFSPIVIGDQLYIAGGETTASGPRTSVEIYPWTVAGFLNRTTGTPLLTARSRMSVVAMGDSLYALAGATSNATATTLWERGTITPGATDLGLNSQMSFAPLAVARSDQSTFVARSLHLLGGTTTLVERGDADATVGLRSVDAGTPLASPHPGGVSAVLGDAVYVIGGGSGAVERAQLVRVSLQEGVLGPFSVVGGWAPSGLSCGIVLGNYLHLFAGNSVLSYRLL